MQSKPMESKEGADLLIAPRWLLSLAPRTTAMSDHAVIVTGGRIVAVGPVAQLEARFEPRERISRPDHVLLPGFVNAHTRASMTLLRGLPVYPAYLRWMRETVGPAELRHVSPDFVRDGTTLAIAQMLRAGITTFSGSDLFPGEAARAAAEARMRAVIGLPVSETASAYAEDAMAHFVRAERLWDEYKSSPWVSLYFALPASYEISDRLLTHLRSVADEIDARVAMPVNESEVEIRDTLSQHGCRPLQRLANVGLLRPGFTALHLNRLDPADLELARQTGIAAVACPQSDLRLGSGACPVASLGARGVAVGLGTGSPISAGAFDLLAEAKLTAQLHASDADARVRAESGEEDSGQLSSDYWLGLATLGGATALGVGGDCGSIEAGKAADLACIHLGSLASGPGATIADAVLFGVTRHQVSDVWVGGRAAVASGHLLAFDEQELQRLAQQWSQQIIAGVAT
jgi:5-methylthioadenosine/S-adenosylhomocysteine deaminase